MSNDILEFIRKYQDQPRLLLPRKCFAGECESYLERGIFVKTNQLEREVDCPNGCGKMAPVRVGSKGDYFAVCTHDVVTEEIELSPDEVELYEFDRVTFDRVATDEERQAIEVPNHNDRLITTVDRIEKTVAAVKKDTDNIKKIVVAVSKGVASIVDWVTRVKDHFWHIFGIHKQLSVEEARGAMGEDQSYLRCFEGCKLKEPHKSQAMEVARWTHSGHPLDHDSTQSAIQKRTAYTINQAARDVLNANYQKWSTSPDAWSDSKLLADACRVFMGKEDDPFKYK